MKKAFYYIFYLGLIAYISACQQRVICPAYHSYFIFDVKETKEVFSLFGADSLPKKNWEVDKEKYGIAKEVSYQKKLDEMRIISMNSSYKKIEDPFEQFNREFTNSDATVYIDSAFVLAQSRGYNDFQNIDQMIYLHHFGKYLPKKGGNRDEFKVDQNQLEAPPTSDGTLEEEKTSKKKRKLWPFRKKNKKSKGDKTEDVNEEGQ